MSDSCITAPFQNPPQQGPTHPDPERRGGISAPGPTDVLCGRGCTRHTGNVVFRHVVRRCRARYAAANPADKTALIRGIAEAMMRLDPPGRFLERGEVGMWHDAGRGKAMDKTRKGLQERRDEGQEECLDEEERRAAGQFEAAIDEVLKGMRTDTPAGKVATTGGVVLNAKAPVAPTLLSSDVKPAALKIDYKSKSAPSMVGAGTDPLAATASDPVGQRSRGRHSLVTLLRNIPTTLRRLAPDAGPIPPAAPAAADSLMRKAGGRRNRTARIEQRNHHVATARALVSSSGQAATAATPGERSAPKERELQKASPKRPPRDSPAEEKVVAKKARIDAFRPSPDSPVPVPAPWQGNATAPPQTLLRRASSSFSKFLRGMPGVLSGPTSQPLEAAAGERALVGGGILGEGDAQDDAGCASEDTPISSHPGETRTGETRKPRRISVMDFLWSKQAGPMEEIAPVETLPTPDLQRGASVFSLFSCSSTDAPDEPSQDTPMSSPLGATRKPRRRSSMLDFLWSKQADPLGGFAPEEALPTPDLQRGTSVFSCISCSSLDVPDGSSLDVAPSAPALRRGSSIFSLI